MRSQSLIYLPYPVRIASPLNHLLQSTWNVKLSNDILCIPHSKGRVKCHTHLYCEVARGCYAVWVVLKPAVTNRSHDHHVTSLSLSLSYLIMYVLSTIGQLLRDLACSSNQSLKHKAAKQQNQKFYIQGREH